MNALLSKQKIINSSWWRSLSYRNQSMDLLCISMVWFLYNRDLKHERVKRIGNPHYVIKGRSNYRLLNAPEKRLHKRILLEMINRENQGGIGWGARIRRVNFQLKILERQFYISTLLFTSFINLFYFATLLTQTSY